MKWSKYHPLVTHFIQRYSSCERQGSGEGNATAPCGTTHPRFVQYQRPRTKSKNYSFFFLLLQQNTIKHFLTGSFSWRVRCSGIGKIISSLSHLGSDENWRWHQYFHRWFFCLCVPTSLDHELLSARKYSFWRSLWRKKVNANHQSHVFPLTNFLSLGTTTSFGLALSIKTWLFYQLEIKQKLEKEESTFQEDKDSESPSLGLSTQTSKRPNHFVK